MTINSGILASSFPRAAHRCISRYSATLLIVDGKISNNFQEIILALADFFLLTETCENKIAICIASLILFPDEIPLPKCFTLKTY